VTDPQFQTKDKPQPQFIIAHHPTENPPRPIAKFGPHEATNGFTFVRANLLEWGKPTDVYLALFGDFTPATGTVDKPVGVKVVKLDTTNGAISDFLVNKTPGQASRHSAGGLEHPSAVAFGPDGNLYVTDWGVANVSVEGLKLEKDTGVIWRVTRGARSSLPGGPTLMGVLVGLIVLGTVTMLMGGRIGRNTTTVKFASGRSTWLTDLLKGALSGLVMGVFAMLVSALALRLPWYAPPRVFAIMVMGRDAIANILEFEPVSFGIGLIVVLVLTALLGVIFAWLLRTNSRVRTIITGLLFGLTIWALLQYFILPLVWPLITEKGFPPLWYAVTFGVYGLTLGVLHSLPVRQQAGRMPAEGERGQAVRRA
jgi:hypothetical protein